MKIDRYGYLSDFAGDGTHGTITPGAPAASSPIGAVSDIDIDPAGNLYLFNDWNQIVRRRQRRGEQSLCTTTE